MQFPIFIELHRSRLLSFLIVVTHLLAASGIFLMPWPWWLRACLLAFLGVAGLLAWRRLGDRAQILVLHQDGGMAVRQDGVLKPVELLPGMTVLPALCVFSYQLEEGQGRVTQVLLPDAADAESMRRLRLWLRRCSQSPEA